ncbi:MAG: DUF1232 domain-containing protein [Deltaproteobacteria bacterium]|nr:DUF1232 domain-containing protein [Deltaproteobacteria bacterium]
MNNRNLSNPGWWQRGLLAGRLCWGLLGDRRVPFYLKLIPLSAVIYFFSPYDLLPDLVIPGLGQIDDLLVIFLACRLFFYLVPSYILREHQEKIIARHFQLY